MGAIWADDRSTISPWPDFGPFWAYTGNQKNGRSYTPTWIHCSKDGLRWRSYILLMDRLTTPRDLTPQHPLDLMGGHVETLIRAWQKEKFWPPSRCVSGPCSPIIVDRVCYTLRGSLQ